MSSATRPRTILRLTAAVLAFAVLGASCSSANSDGSDDAVALDDIERVAALTPFDSCDSLLEHLQTEALERVGPYGLDDQPLYLPTPDAFAAEEDTGLAAPRESTAPAPTTAPAGAGGGVSGTNVQVAGVDEPDLVKADRRRMVLVAENRLAVVDLTGPEPEVAGRLDLPVGEHELLVAGDRALVLSRSYDDALTAEPLIDEAFPGDIAPSDYTASPDQATLTEVDLGDPTNPTVTGTLRVDGRYLSGRMQGDVARVVVASPPPNLTFVQPTLSTEEGNARAEEANRQIIEGSTLEDWLPGWSLELDDTERSGRLDDCDTIHHPTEFAGFGLVSTLTVDLATDLGEPDAVSVLGAGDTVYASADNLYVATERTTEEPSGDEPETVSVNTAIHRFSAPATGAVEYEASGEVEGRLLNQFSLSEHEDVLRVASTRGEPWFDGGSDSLVTTLGVEGDRLVELGRVDGLGRGEEIFAVRFVGPVGYVVTFRQTDPLYVVDLRDPASPAVDGELKILGYSAYLHPLDDTHVLGVGQDADQDGRTSGTQVSLFDVSDPTSPTRTAQFTVPGGSSEVEWDHRAFLWWEPTGTVVIPVENYRDLDQFESSALVMGVDIDADSVTERGRIDHGSSPVRRSVVVDGALVTIDQSGLVFSNLSDLSRQADVAL